MKTAIIFLSLLGVGLGTVLASERSLKQPGTALPSLGTTFFNSDASLNWSNYLGKVVVVQSFATWCAPCKKALDHYDQVIHELKRGDVVYVAISFDADKAIYNQWVAANREKFKAVSFARADVTKASWQKAIEEFGGDLPGFYVLNREGLIVVGYRGFFEKWVNNPEANLREDHRLIIALRAAGIEVEAPRKSNTSIARER